MRYSLHTHSQRILLVFARWQGPPSAARMEAAEEDLDNITDNVEPWLTSLVPGPHRTQKEKKLRQVKNKLQREQRRARTIVGA